MTCAKIYKMQYAYHYGHKSTVLFEIQVYGPLLYLQIIFTLYIDTLVCKKELSLRVHCMYIALDYLLF